MKHYSGFTIIETLLAAAILLAAAYMATSVQIRTTARMLWMQNTIYDVYLASTDLYQLCALAQVHEKKLLQTSTKNMPKGSLPAFSPAASSSKLEACGPSMRMVRALPQSDSAIKDPVLISFIHLPYPVSPS